MQLSDIKTRLDRLETEKLIDIVKNYQQYGYNKEIRDYVIDLLKEKGFSLDDLRMTGNLANDKFEMAKVIFNQFRSTSTAAFACYLILFIARLLLPNLHLTSSFQNLIVSIGSILTGVLFLIFLLISFLKQSEFYKLTGEDYGSGALIYLLFGVPLYMVAYFIFRNQMNERMKAIQ